MFALVKLLVFAPVFNTQKKHVLYYFALKMAAFLLLGGGTADNRQLV